MKTIADNQTEMDNSIRTAAELKSLAKIALLLISALALAVLSGCTQARPAADQGHRTPKVESKKPARPEIARVNSGRVVKTTPAQDPANKESVVTYCGNRTVRAVPDASVSMPWLMSSRPNCFIVMSKKDYYLYVYERRGDKCVMLARYDCAFALNCGNKQQAGDMRTPACADIDHPFQISQICDARKWRHDFNDGRGPIKAYGDWFLRLDIGTENRSIGIHGSTNNEVTVPGRASEGCIRLKDDDIRDLKENYARVGMKVYIKAETVGDHDFETEALTAFNISNPGKARKRDIDPHLKLTDADRLAANS